MSQEFVPRTTTQVVIAHQDTNAIGTVGFVISLLGVISCGLLGPIGLIFSLIGLMYRPKEMAIAGTIFGLLGSLWLFFFGFAFITAMYMAMFAVKEAGREISRQAKEAVERQENEVTQRLQKQATELEITPITVDPVLPVTTALPSKPQNTTAEPAANPTEPSKPIEIGPPSDDSSSTSPPAPNPAPFLKGSSGSGNSPPVDRTPRKFSSADGKFSVEAIFLSKSGEKVKLKRTSDDKEITVDFEILSIEDQQWIKRGAYKQ